VDSNGRTIWIADAHRDDGKRFVVRADEKLTAFLELEIGDLRFRKILNVAQAAPIHSWNRKLMSSPERFKASRGCAGIALGLVAGRETLGSSIPATRRPAATIMSELRCPSGEVDRF
jgi:hypothetical protein